MLKVSFISSTIHIHICVLHIHTACSYCPCSHSSLLHPAHSIPSSYPSHCTLTSDYWSFLVSCSMCSVLYWCLPSYSNNLHPLLDLYYQSLNHLCHRLQITGSQQCVLMKTIHIILIKIWTDVSVKISLTRFISWNMPTNESGIIKHKCTVLVFIDPSISRFCKHTKSSADHPLRNRVSTWNKEYVAIIMAHQTSWLAHRSEDFDLSYHTFVCVHTFLHKFSMKNHTFTISEHFINTFMIWGGHMTSYNSSTFIWFVNCYSVFVRWSADCWSHIKHTAIHMTVFDCSVPEENFIHRKHCSTPKWAVFNTP